MKKEDVEQAAQQYAEGPECTWVGTTALEYAFIAGAKWDRSQMLKEAVEGVVCYGSKGAYIETDFLGEYDTDVYGNPGDKVRIIILRP